MRFSLSAIPLLVVVTNGYQPSHRGRSEGVALGTARQAQAWAGATATAALSTLLLTGEPALASPTAAQISLNSLPPSSISVQIQDLPYVLFVLLHRFGQ
jgi:hypothetical protein